MIQDTVAITNSYQPGINPGQQGQILQARKSGVEVTSERASLATDTVSLSYSTDSVMLYDSSMTLQGGQQDGFDLLRGLVMNIFKEQGLSLSIPTASGEVSLDTLSQEEASALVADDGYFGVEQTSDRIVDFAIGIAGNDPSRIEAIKAGVEQGFNEALEAFGGWLPDISYTTYDAVMDKLDAWVAEQSDSTVS